MIRIALDPGHGGKDPGATYKGITEAKLVFNERQEDGVTVADGLTNRLAHYLRERGHSVLFTRSADENPPKRVRAERAISWGAQMYISVHVNAGGGSGSEVWINPDCRFVEGSKAIANVALEVAQRLGGCTGPSGPVRIETIGTLQVGTKKHSHVITPGSIYGITPYCYSIPSYSNQSKSAGEVDARPLPEAYIPR